MLLLLAGLALATDEAAESAGPHAHELGAGVRIAEDRSIAWVLEDGPAWQAGLRPGDTLHRLDGTLARWMSPWLIQATFTDLQGRALAVERDTADGPEALWVEQVHFDPWSATWVGPDARTVTCEATCTRGDCVDGTGEVEVTCGEAWRETFRGTFVGGQPEGRGLWTRPHGTYRGQVTGGEIEGWGRLELPDGRVVMGTFDHGESYGLDIIEYPDGTAYRGDVYAALPMGIGVRLDPDTGDVRYEGWWVAGRYHGQGTLTLDGGGQHEGTFRYGFAHGPGRTVFPSGEVVEGGFVKGRLQGPGRRVYADGRVYQGAFVDSQPQGWGAMQFQDGKVHEGAFEDGKPVGAGIRTFPEGHRVEGLFVDPFRALGRLYDADGTLVYEGWTRLGTAEGWGRRVEDGERERTRWWFNDEPHRSGTHPRGERFADEEKAAFDRVDWDAVGLAAFDGSTMAEAPAE